MPLQFATGSAAGADFVHEGLRRISTRALPVHCPGFHKLQVHPPHAVYDLPSNDVAAGAGLEAAQLTGLRYHLHSFGKPVAAAEVRTDAFGTATHLACVNFGGFIEATADAFDELAAHPEVHKGSFTARLLRSKLLPMLAVWLSSNTGTGDLIYPLDPSPDGLQAETLYTANDFLHVLRPIIRNRLIASRNNPRSH